MIKTRYTNAEFLQKRHALENSSALTQFESSAQQLVSSVADAMPISTQGLEKGYAITRVESELNFNATIESIKTNVLAQEALSGF